jgi:acid phosphatase class B
MKSIVRITLVSLCLLFVNTFSVKAQWQEISNIYGGNPLKLIEETPTKLVGIAETRVYIANKSDYFWQL